MKNKKTKTNEENFFSDFSKFVKKHYARIILFAVTFGLVSIIAFVKTATSSTISSYKIEDYEIGQIADRTIIAQKSIPADFSNPIGIEKGEKIIRKGFAITEQEHAKLEKMAASPAYIDFRAFANNLLFLVLISSFWIFLFSPVCLNRKIEFKECLLEAIFFVLVYGVTAFGAKSAFFLSPYSLPMIIPASFFTFLISVLFGNLSGVFFSVLVSFGVLNACSYQLVPFLFILASNLSASRIVRKIQRRIDMVFASLLLSILNVVFLAVLKIIFNDSFLDAFFTIPGVAFNGFISGILALGFLTPLESILNTASVFRLMDLSDLNNPLMKKMLLTASGTYNHSMMVASLAESACREIGANALIARVGAYYHDIGKMENPEYFVENQHGVENKHDSLTPAMSVSVIRSHVKKGVEKARNMRMPKQVVDIIAEHHGDSVIAYFYSEALKIDSNARPEDYSYSGNPPSSKESAVVMLADTVEAACRTLEKPTIPRLEKFIQTLFDGKINHGQLENCNLTFSDVTKIKNCFVTILAGYYHSRIEYPDQKNPDEKSVLGEKTLDEARKSVGASEKAEAVNSTKKAASSGTKKSDSAEKKSAKSSTSKKTGTKSNTKTKTKGK